MLKLLRIYFITVSGQRLNQYNINNALIPNKHFLNYKFTSKQREAVNLHLVFV